MADTQTEAIGQPKPAINRNLGQARAAKNDEFYTQITDVEKELRHHKEQLRGKVVFCNCDDPEYSNFWRFFSLNFDAYGLKKLVTTHYEADRPSYKLELSKDRTGDGRIDGQDVVQTPLSQNGDFRSPESVAILEEADVVITNPPFSLFREYVAQLVEHDKKFLIIGSKNAITYKEIFPLIKENKMWLGNHPMSRDMFFDVSDDYAKELRETKKEGSAYRVIDDKVCARAPAVWFTNLDVSKRHEALTPYKSYSPDEYPRYDNYDAINVDEVVEIPADYEGVMGVPITFLDKYNPAQFEILGITDRGNEYGLKTKEYETGDVPNANDLNRRAAIKLPDGSYKGTYARLLIRRRAT